MQTVTASRSPAANVDAAPQRPASALRAWLADRHIEDIVVVSPHLDDGVFSAHVLLTLTPLRRTLMTVFSDAAPGPATAWGQATGFESTEAEFTARRIEDTEVAHALGIAHVHLNRHVDGWSAAAAARVSEQVGAMLGGPPERALVLLPAGAGGEVTGARRWIRRARRQPLGSQPHGEHLLVRDELVAPLRERGVRLGFYAELPYMWADDRHALQARVRQLTGQPGVVFEVPPDLAAKHAAAIGYRSQVMPILGNKTEFQRRVLSHPELFFLFD